MKISPFNPDTAKKIDERHSIVYNFRWEYLNKMYVLNKDYIELQANAIRRLERMNKQLEYQYNWSPFIAGLMLGGLVVALGMLGVFEWTVGYGE